VSRDTFDTVENLVK